MQRAAGDLHAPDGGREVGDVEDGGGRREERDELAAARAHVPRPPDPHIECVQRERERHADGEGGDADERTGERPRRDETGDGETEQEPDGCEHAGHGEGEAAATAEHVEELDGPQRRQGRWRARRGAEGRLGAAHRRASLPVGSAGTVERSGAVGPPTHGGPRSRGGLR